MCPLRARSSRLLASGSQTLRPPTGARFGKAVSCMAFQPDFQRPAKGGEDDRPAIEGQKKEKGVRLTNPGKLVKRSAEAVHLTPLSGAGQAPCISKPVSRYRHFPLKRTLGRESPVWSMAQDCSLKTAPRTGLHRQWRRNLQTIHRRRLGNLVLRTVKKQLARSRSPVSIAPRSLKPPNRVWPRDLSPRTASDCANSPNPCPPKRPAMAEAGPRPPVPDFPVSLHQGSSTRSSETSASLGEAVSTLVAFGGFGGSKSVTASLGSRPPRACLAQAPAGPVVRRSFCGLVPYRSEKRSEILPRNSVASILSYAHP